MILSSPVAPSETHTDERMDLSKEWKTAQETTWNAGNFTRTFAPSWREQAVSAEQRFLLLIYIFGYLDFGK